jgi:hypothetical protein
MNEDKFNLEMRSFLKRVGITSQREIEKVVRDALENGVLQGNEQIAVKVTLEIEAPETTKTIEGTISLE